MHPWVHVAANVLLWDGTGVTKAPPGADLSHPVSKLRPRGKILSLPRGDRGQQTVISAVCRAEERSHYTPKLAACGWTVSAQSEAAPCPYASGKQISTFPMGLKPGFNSQFKISWPRHSPSKLYLSSQVALTALPVLLVGLQEGTMGLHGNVLLNMQS